MLILSIFFLYSALPCLSLAPTKVESMGIISKYIYPEFVLIDDRPQKQFQSFLSSANTLILSNFLKNLPKTEKALQILSLPDRGLYELILLTSPNNFNNKVIIVKSDPAEYVWVNKNLHLNGLEKEQNLYHMSLGERNSIEQVVSARGNSIDKLFYSPRICSSCQKNYQIETTISYLFHLHSEKQSIKALHIFTTISSLSQARKLKKQVEKMQKISAAIEIVLSLMVPLAKVALIPNIKNLRVYSIGLKIEDKTTALQFKLVQRGERINSEMPQEHYRMVEQGVYYISNRGGLVEKQH